MSTKPTICNNCGACCMAQVSPPGYCGQEMVFFSTPEDERRFNSAPQEAQDLVWSWQDRIDNLPDGAPLPDDEPCCWFDVKTLRCRFYDWRPSVCRDFDVGSEGCRCWRDEFNIDVEDLKCRP